MPENIYNEVILPFLSVVQNPTEREKAGKKSTGQIELSAYHEAGQVNIEISDDGKGLDPETISQVALRLLHLH